MVVAAKENDSSCTCDSPVYTVCMVDIYGAISAAQNESGSIYSMYRKKLIADYSRSAILADQLVERNEQ